MNKFPELMQSTTVHYTQNSPIEGEIQVKIAGSYIEERMNVAYEELRHTASIKGYRKGKVPASLIRQYYKTQVIRDTFEHLVTESSREAAIEKKIPVVGDPRVSKTNWLSWKEGSDMEFTAKLELLPDPELKKYKGLSITINDFSVSADAVEKTLEQILEPKAVLQTIDANRGVREKDFVMIDFEGYLNGTPLNDAKAENFLLEMGGPNTMREFQDGLLGVKPGQEKIIHVVYPEDYNNKEIAGKKVEYKVKLHEIKQKQYPEITDEIAKEFQAESVEDLKAKIEKNILERARMDEKAQKEEKILQALVDANPTEIPNTLVQYQLNYLIRELSYMLEQQRFSQKLIEEYVSRHLDELITRAKREVVLALLLPKIVKAEKIAPTEAEIQERIELMAKAAGKDVSEVKRNYSNEESRNNLKSQIARDQAIDFVVKQAKISVEKSK